MSTTLFKSIVVGVLLAGSLVEAKPLAAELIMPGGRSWKGQIVGRDGEWLEFTTAKSTRAIRIGISTVQELRFDVKIDAEKLLEMKKNREFDRVIAALEKVLEPYSEYSDVPSNLTKYNALLMELYYRTQKFDESLKVSSKIAKDDRDTDLQEKARMYQALALIDAGRSEKAEKLLSEYGWDGDLSGDTSPDKLYITAKLMTLKKEYSKAMELVAKVIAFNSQDPDWMQPSEMLCAEIYTELGMYDSAEEVCRQILMLYRDTPEYDKAGLLKIRIEKLRAEKELAGNLDTEEA